MAVRLWKGVTNPPLIDGHSRLMSNFSRMFCLMLAVSALPAYADMDGKFPGKGSLSVWSKSARMVNEANSLDRAGKHKEALNLYKNALRIYPHDANTWYSIGLALDEAGHPAESEPYLRKSFAMQPHFDSAVNLAIVLVEQRKWYEAESMLAQAKHLIKDDADKKTWSDNVSYLNNSRQHK